MTPPNYPTPVVTVGSEDLTDLIIPGSLSRLMTERGEARCEFSIQLASENEVASNAIVEVMYRRNAWVLVGYTVLA